jgi:hypothetical protein
MRYHGSGVGYTSEPSPLGTIKNKIKKKSVQTISTPKSIIHPKIQRKLKIWVVGTAIIRHDPCTPLPKQYENEKPRNPPPQKMTSLGGDIGQGALMKAGPSCNSGPYLEVIIYIYSQD